MGVTGGGAGGGERVLRVTGLGTVSTFSRPLSCSVFVLFCCILSLLAYFPVQLTGGKIIAQRVGTVSTSSRPWSCSVFDRKQARGKK